ncbi:hypothetical protein RHMOL_Rhmol12G0043300 [Rhododendron molle]|uniref:Uncharacterized protein n=1 Tax=Rhododendron molle TaxID=49168 RepID=A0ACC0LE99_RHOML|nr:hypothetical protein RHMOL_Rhmol12G0043300 [Rhododendron molle]
MAVDMACPDLFIRTHKPGEIIPCPWGNTCPCLSTSEPSVRDLPEDLAIDQILLRLRNGTLQLGHLAFSPCPVLTFHRIRNVYSFLVGFGFDLTTRSIKVVKVVNFYGDEAYPYEYINCAEVYDLGSSFWRVLPMDDTVQEVSVFNSPTHGMYNNDGVFHWYWVRRFRGIVEPFVHLVLSFDMNRELFHVALMPEKFNAIISSPLNIVKVCHFSLLRDSLAKLR